MITVDKARREWRLDDVIISVETVVGLGSFVELEYAWFCLQSPIAPVRER
jgi:adenylate cyclase class IV